jgi:hypothetical protein
LSRFGGKATSERASGYVSTFRGEGIERMSFLGGVDGVLRDIRLTESGLDAFRLTAPSLISTPALRPGISKSVCSLGVPLGAGTRDLFEALGVPVHARDLLLVVKPFVGIEGARRGLPQRAAESCRTLGIFAVEEACETLAWWLGSTREHDVVSSSDRAAGAGLGGPSLAGGQRARSARLSLFDNGSNRFVGSRHLVRDLNRAYPRLRLQ